MSGSMRYHNPAICEYLASQYVVGVMTPRVRARVETLRIYVPELHTAILFWSQKLSSVQADLPEKTPSDDVWQKIENRLFKEPQTTAEKTSLWQSLRFWQFTGLGASMASVVFAIMLFVFPTQSTSELDTALPLVSSTPSYIAMMSPVVDQERSQDDIRFVVNVYQKTASSPSKLFIQWSEKQPRSVKGHMHLWAKDQETGVLSYIGVEPSGAMPWNLDKDTWQAVSNSSELFFTTTSDKPNAQNTLFSGPCIQLGSWKQDLS